MNSAVFALAVNASLAAVVAIAFSALQGHMALGNWWQSFSGSYLLGMATPLSELAVRWGIAVPFFMFLSYASFLGAFLLFARALARYYNVRISQWGFASLFVGGLSLRLVIWGGARDELVYELCYQAPFAAALATSAYLLWKSKRRFKAELALLAILSITSIHFLLKAYAANQVGSGAVATAYHSSQYALVSQSATAVLLVSVALSTMAVIMRDALTRASLVAQTDELSGLLNRRGFESGAATLIASRKNCTAMMCDLDHFKSVNDDHGHAAGDEIIRCISKLILQIAPAGSVIARTGGEEFSTVLPVGIDDAYPLAEQLRAALSTESKSIIGRPVTVSIGLAGLQDGSLSLALRAADEALYASKRAGRDRTSIARSTMDGMERHPLSVA